MNNNHNNSDNNNKNRHDDNNKDNNNNYINNNNLHNHFLLVQDPLLPPLSLSSLNRSVWTRSFCPTTRRPFSFALWTTLPSSRRTATELVWRTWSVTGRDSSYYYVGLQGRGKRWQSMPWRTTWVWQGMAHPLYYTLLHSTTLYYIWVWLRCQKHDSWWCEALYIHAAMWLWGMNMCRAVIISAKSYWVWVLFI